MSEHAQGKDDARVSLSAFVDRDLREQLEELARAERVVPAAPTVVVITKATNAAPASAK
jgi:hypothetical protein